MLFFEEGIETILGSLTGSLRDHLHSNDLIYMDFCSRDPKWESEKSACLRYPDMLFLADLEPARERDDSFAVICEQERITL